jgi:hypothetical protein
MVTVASLSSPLSSIVAALPHYLITLNVVARYIWYDSIFIGIDGRLLNKRKRICTSCKCIVILRARLLLEAFLLGVITIPRAYGLPGVKLLEASTFLEAFLLRNLLLLGAYRFLESTHPSQKKKD